MRATRADQWPAGWGVVNRPQVAAIRAAEQVAWQRVHTVAAWVGGTATYRAALHAWRTARYDLDRAPVPVPPLGISTPAPAGIPRPPDRARTS